MLAPAPTAARRAGRELDEARSTGSVDDGGLNVYVAVKLNVGSTSKSSSSRVPGAPGISEGAGAPVRSVVAAVDKS